MKKTTTLLLSILMLFSTFFGLIACGNDDKNFDINSVTCIKLDLKTISTEYWENSYRADEKYVDNYVLGARYKRLRKEKEASCIKN